MMVNRRHSIEYHCFLISLLNVRTPCISCEYPKNYGHPNLVVSNVMCWKNKKDQ